MSFATSISPAMARPTGAERRELVLDVLRLRLLLGWSLEKIERRLHISERTAKRYTAEALRTPEGDALADRSDDLDIPRRR